MNEPELKILIFVVGGEYYATDIGEVERILGYEDTTRLPDSPEFVDGLINYEGGILPILSIAKRFKLNDQELTHESKIIVSKQNDGKFGVIVNSVSEVKNVTKDNIENTPAVVSGLSKRYIKGLIKLDGKIIIFLNLANILTEEEKALL
ncbi:purine-binding chemotaxis protein CheW [Clostridium acidisoli DSM 12555]|jgi:purine-binding chemotaxis protein CheW|uniref:Purine-binding chemotaxis protein CheW n=1 Tax=Clostridium acidisoli DSM 12555 TaxID=1121291 RepID=A0A1W1X264_9CLOT|nr:chemotaxis protein CheW [Clostridium acidisoli]SMC18032.1 purine-binding chemotaxis protein CheW [Clostridium acidisoli DSM 12555]